MKRNLTYPLPPHWAPGFGFTIVVPAQKLPDDLLVPHQAPDMPILDLLLSPADAAPMLQECRLLWADKLSSEWLRLPEQRVLRQVLWPSLTAREAKRQWLEAWAIPEDEWQGLRLVVLTLVPDKQAPIYIIQPAVTPQQA